MRVCAQENAPPARIKMLCRSSPVPLLVRDEQASKMTGYDDQRYVRFNEALPVHQLWQSQRRRPRWRGARQRPVLAQSAIQAPCEERREWVGTCRTSDKNGRRHPPPFSTTFSASGPTLRPSRMPSASGPQQLVASSEWSRMRMACHALEYGGFRGIIQMAANATGRKGGAGSGNRTRIASLEGWCFTTKLYPRRDRLCHEALPPVNLLPINQRPINLLSTRMGSLALCHRSGYCYII